MFLLQCLFITLTQDSQISAIANGSLLSETLFSTANENIGVVSGYPGFLHSIKGAADLHPSSLYDHHMNSADGDVSWNKTDKFGSRPDEGSLQFLQKRSRNIGSKSRRFLIDAEDAMELKLTWEEAQELLRPAPTAKPTVVMIEDYEFEEYDVSLLFISLFLFQIMEHPLCQAQKADLCSSQKYLNDLQPDLTIVHTCRNPLSLQRDQFSPSVQQGK
jgi:hypothetical protein